MGSAIAVFLRNPEAEFVVLERFEKVDRTFSGYAGSGQIARARGVCRAFLRTAESQKFTQRRLLACCHDTHARFASSGSNGRCSQYQCGDTDAARRARAIGIADDMAAFDMSQFMGDDALYFIGGLRRFDQAAVNVDNLSTRHKCVNRPVVDQDDIDMRGIQPCCLYQRRRNFFEKGLGFRIAQNGLRHCRLHTQSECKDDCNDSPQMAHGNAQHERRCDVNKVNRQ